MLKVTATSSTIATFAVGVAVAARRGARRVPRHAGTTRTRPASSPAGSLRRRPSPAASLQWLSPSTGTFAVGDVRELERIAS